MKTNMKISMIDDSSLGLLLGVEGYSDERLEEAYRTIQEKIYDAVVLIFTHLDMPLPSTIWVELLPNTLEEMEGAPVRQAGFNPESSDDDNLYFQVHEAVVRSILEKKDEGEWVDTVIHEMIHAADQSMLDKSRDLLVAVENEYRHRGGSIVSGALLMVLQVLSNYRGEGVAVLGSHLLARRAFGNSLQALSGFSFILQVSLLQARHWVEDDRVDDVSFFQNEARFSAYSFAPYVLLSILARRGVVDAQLANRAVRGLDGGPYDLSDDEVFSIIRASLQTSLEDYLVGLTQLGDNLKTLYPFLAFCARLRDDYDEGNIDAFSRLLQNPGSAEEFLAVMDQIMGFPMPEDELDGLYAEFRARNPKGPTGLAENVDRLFSVMKSDRKEEDRRIARWALTYFFDDVDLIHDDVKGLGLVDDAVVLDCALRLLA